MAEAAQREIVARRRAGELCDQLLLLEHPPVVTTGRGAHEENLRLTPEQYAEAGIELHDVGRGGDVTYHGPGQLVGYPILALAGEERDAHAYLRNIEQGLIDGLAQWGVRGGRVEGLTGVWVGASKLAAIGVRLSSGWITSHGFALNVEARLEGFETIVPCGIADKGVTSLEACIGRRLPLPEVAERLAEPLATRLGRELVWEAGPGPELAAILSG